MPDISCTVKTSGNPILVNYSVAATNAANKNIFVEVYIDGQQASTSAPILGAAASINACLAGSVIIPLAAGVHKVDLYWRVDGGTGQTNGVRRFINVREL